MKKILFILLLICPVCFGQASLSENSEPLNQVVTLREKSQTLERILWSLTRQTGYYFSYNSSAYSPDSTYSIIAHKQSLEDVLKLLFADSLIKFTIIDNQIAVGHQIEQINTDTLTFLCSGKIRDATNYTPIPNVNISLLKHSLGTITNNEGSFVFKVTSEYLNDTISITCIGYKPYKIPVKSCTDRYHQIQLKPVTISLQEVIIRSTNPNNLISNTINQIPINYPQKAYRQKCFYREQIKSNKQIKSITEAILDVYKSPAKRSFINDQVQIIKGRKSNWLSSTDTISVKLKAGIQSVLDLDIVKNGIEFLTTDHLNLYHFTYNDIIVDNNRLYYQLLFKPIAVLENQIQFEGDLLIDIETLALRRIRFNIPESYLSQATSFFILKKNNSLKTHVLSSQYEVEYQQIGNKNYPLAIRFSNIFKIKKRGQLWSKRYELTAETAVLSFDTINASPIPRRQRIKPHTILDKEPAVNSNDFWEGYNIILPEMQLKEILEISKKMEF